MTDPSELNEAMICGLQRLGDLGEIEDALRSVPRHLFVPDMAYVATDGEPGYVIDRNRDPGKWLKATYLDEAIITQLDDGATDITTGEGDYTSSLSAPSVVVAFLSLLNAGPSDRILEIGTGTGWTTALLAQTVGAEQVVSIEIDQQIYAQATGNLKKGSCSPLLICGDGVDGCSENAPYDRMHVTCGINEIPSAWIQQTRPQGRIVAPYRGQLASITVNEDGTVTEKAYGDTRFMMLRSQRN